MNILFIPFLVMMTLVWFSTYGYIAVLSLIRLIRRRIDVDVDVDVWPEIAVVIPTLNEEDIIQSKLSDLRNVNYPADRIQTLVVDGGSHDRTTELVQKEIDRNQKIQLLRMNNARNKIDQVIYSLKLIEQEYVVFTDADSHLDDSCIKELIRFLKSDKQTAVVGASVKPASRLLEELIHWRILNFLWWLEGEAFSTAGFSGVCYAVRRKALELAHQNIKAEDIHLSLTVSSSGRRVRLCRSAIATELRVPQTTREFLQFRWRRGSGYLSALRHFKSLKIMPLSHHIVRSVRIWQFAVIPWLGITVAALGLILFITKYWIHSIFISMFFIIPTITWIHIIKRKTHRAIGWVKLITAFSRYIILLLISLITMRRHASIKISRWNSP